MSDDKELNVKFRFTVDPSGARTAKQTTEEVNKSAKKTGDSLDDAGKRIARIELASSQLVKVGAVMATASGAMIAGMTKAATFYVQQVGTSEQVSRRWLGASKELEQAQMRIGRAVATQAVPFLEKAAELAEKAAAFAEENPGVVKGGIGAVAGVGMAGLAIGGLASTVSAVLKITETLGKLGLLSTGGGAINALGGVGKALYGPAAAGAGGTGAAAGGATAAATTAGVTVGGVIASVIGGLLAGFGANDLLSKTKVGQNAGVQPTNRVMTVAAYGLGNLFGGESKGLQWAQTIGQLTGAIDKTSTAAQKAGHELDYTSGQISAYMSYMRQEQQAERAHKLQVYRMTRDFQRQELFDLQDYTRQRSRSMRDFQRQESYAERDYYRQRAIRARDFGIQIQRQEYDHQKELRRSKEDHEWSMRKIILSGDAMAFWEENYQYEKQRRRAEEDYQLSLSRENEDYARERADQEREYQISKQRRMEEFAIRLKDEETDFQIRRKRNKEQFQLQLKDAEVSLNEERLQRRQALMDTLRDQKGVLEQERIMRQEFNRAMLADLQAAINAAQSGTNLLASGSRASGGYVSAGLWRMHDNEFVMNADTTRAAESMAGHSLNQDDILGMLARGGGGGRTMYDQRQFVFGSGVTAEDKVIIRSIVRDEFARALA